MHRDTAWALLTEKTHGESLLKHARAVELVMRAYAEKLGLDLEQWGAAGLLHDADYEAHPEQHPQVIVQRLREMGEEQIAHAISAHYTGWGVAHESWLDKALIACDELVGFVVACAKVRPDGVHSLTPKSVRKKLKDRAFAAKVDRAEIDKAVALFEVDMVEHVEFIIEALAPHAVELGIASDGGSHPAAVASAPAAAR